MPQKMYKQYFFLHTIVYEFSFLHIFIRKLRVNKGVLMSKHFIYFITFMCSCSHNIKQDIFNFVFFAAQFDLKKKPET